LLSDFSPTFPDPTTSRPSLSQKMDFHSEIVSDEIKVLQSIFMENYSKQVVATKIPWKEDLLEDLHSIKLNFDDISMVLSFKFTLNYPQEPPVLSLSDCSVDSKDLLAHIHKQLPVKTRI
jgi:hypothetical protein